MGVSNERNTLKLKYIGRLLKYKLSPKKGETDDEMKWVQIFRDIFN